MALKFHTKARMVEPEAYTPKLPVDCVPPNNPAPVVYLGVDVTFENVAAFVRQRQRAACSELGTAFGINYITVAHLMDALEERGVVPPLPAGYCGPRKVLV